MKTDICRVAILIIFLLMPSMGAMCTSTMDPVIPESVDAFVSDDLQDPLWLGLSSEFSEAQFFGTKTADGSIDQLERLIVTSKRDGLSVTAEIDEEGRLWLWQDNMGTTMYLTYSDTEVFYDYVDSNGESGSFSIPLSAFPTNPSKPNVRGKRTGDNPAQSIVTPGTIGVVTSVTRNGQIVRDAMVTVDVDYFPNTLGTGINIFDDPALEDKYFTSFTHRTEPLTTNFDRCVSELETLNSYVGTAGLVLGAGTLACKLTSITTPPTLALCFLLDSSAAMFLEVGLFSAEVTTLVPNVTCYRNFVPADPDVATISVTAAVSGEDPITQRATVNLRELPEPRIVNFSFPFFSSDDDCAPNSVFDVLRFDNGASDNETSSLICLTGNAEKPVIDWSNEVDNPIGLEVFDTVAGEYIWRIRVDDVAGGDRLTPPFTYGIVDAPIVINELITAQPLTPGNRYRVDVNSLFGETSMSFISR